MDRLSQLQECIDKLLAVFSNATGVLQRDAPLIAVSQNQPVVCWTAEQCASNLASCQKLAQRAAVELVEEAKKVLMPLVLPDQSKHACHLLQARNRHCD